MFGQENRFKTNPITRPVIAIINSESEWLSLQKSNQIGKDYKYSFYCSVSHLYEQYQEYCSFNEEGIINIKWHLNVFPKFPSLIICLFPVDNNFEEKANSFIKEISNIKEIDMCVNIIIIVKFQKNTISLSLDKKDIYETFSQVTDKDYIFITKKDIHFFQDYYLV